jgi:WhiB family redox-sensing transcriptional regulator
MSHTTRRVTTQAAPRSGWQTRGACRTADPDLFHPIGGSKEARAQAAEAKQYCRRCPVRDICLSWALETRQDDGVLGGLTEEERRAIHRRRPRYSLQRKAAQSIIANRLAEFQGLMGQGLELLDVAKAMGTNVQTVNNVITLLTAQERAEEVQAA